MEIVLIAVILILSILIRLIGPTFLTRRSLKSVLVCLKKKGALSNATARPLDELNIGPQHLGAKFTRMGDYRLKALDALKETEIVQTTEDDKLFIDIENLLASNLVKTVACALERPPVGIMRRRL